MRRIAILGTALLVLCVGAASALAAPINTYTGTLKFSKGTGSKSAPKPVSYVQDYAANGTSGNRTATLLDIKTSIYGLVADGKDFPTCSVNTIAHAQNDTVCPPKAMVATGAITAVLGSASDFTAPGTACNPLLHVWNGGQGKLVFFFVDQGPAHLCLGGALTTGQVGPYPATYKTVGKKYLVTDLPIPKYVDFPAPSLVGSLLTSHLTWLKSTTTVHGKTVAASASVGCLRGKRPYSLTFRAQLGSKIETDSISHSAPC